MSAAPVAARLPDIAALRRWSVSLALLDAVMSPEWQWRYFSFDPEWAPGEAMASMRNGSGDEYSIVFSDAGAYIRGFDHESPLSPWAQSPPGLVPGLVAGVPPSLRANITEPAFSIGGISAITVCMWREPGDHGWHWGEPDDAASAGEDGGASWLFQELDGEPSTYVAFAEEYYERSVEPGPVEQLFAFEPLVPDIVRRLNPEADVAVAVEEARRIGYPT